MATIVDKTACELAGRGQEGGLLPVSPFTALQYHFGMLLGVDDLETAQAYPRGKVRLHNAWLHREGVVWGLNVRFNPRQELVVDPGLALDAAGHELHLDHQACLDVGRWFAKHKDDPEFTFTDGDAGTRRFTVQVVARFKACLTRPVPAIAEPCAGAENDTAYSRVFETIELLLRPVRPPKDRGYHRLRVLFELEPDSAPYADVQTERLAIQALPTHQQPAAYLEALRRFAAFDEIDLAPQAATATEPASIFPEDPTEVVLATVADITVAPTAAGDWALVAPLPAPDVTVRPSHIATATIQELLCGPVFTGVAADDGTQATGPTITKATLVEASVSMTVSRPLAKASLTPEAFSVTTFDANGWKTVAIRAVDLEADGTITVRLDEPPAGDMTRFIARGTGPTPLVAADDLAPLGAPGASGADEGVDFVKRFERS
jgi:hypothetical protein